MLDSIAFSPPFPNEEGVPSKKLTYHHFEGTFEDEFHFSKVGYVSSLEGQFFFLGDKFNPKVLFMEDS